ncbi:tRNA (adenosine(37)-N6)-threonylcarbamoyltransferase complex ATPase subunit type 1 TsaE [Rhodoflexus sp.]
MDFLTHQSCSEALRLVCHHIGELDAIARTLADFAQQHTIWLFEGDLGAGKTTLIQHLCKLWGVQENVSSPTFSLVNEYALPGTNATVFHFDFYRLSNEAEAIDIGVEEYFYSGNRCLIEWGSRIAGLIPPQNLTVRISTASDFSRIIDLYRYD